MIFGDVAVPLFVDWNVWYNSPRNSAESLQSAGPTIVGSESPDNHWM